MKILIILWLVFFVSHSLFAATSVKNFFAKILGKGFRYYRLAYNILSFVILSLIFIEILRIESEAIFVSIPFFKFMGGTLILAGLYIIAAAFKRIDFWAFIGFNDRNDSPNGLVTEGWYKVVRHPLYWGTFLFLNGIFFLKPTIIVLFSVLLCIFYIIIGIEFEEKKLRQQFGRAYDDYAFGKKKFIPFVY